MEPLGIINISLFFIISIFIWLLVGLKWNGIQLFYHRSYSYFDLSFILFYFFEQIGLAYLIWDGFDAQIVAGIFSIIIITTASIQNNCLGTI